MPWIKTLAVVAAMAPGMLQAQSNCASRDQVVDRLDWKVRRSLLWWRTSKFRKHPRSLAVRGKRHLDHPDDTRRWHFLHHGLRHQLARWP